MHWQLLQKNMKLNGLPAVYNILAYRSTILTVVTSSVSGYPLMINEKSRTFGICFFRYILLFREKPKTPNIKIFLIGRNLHQIN